MANEEKDVKNVQIKSEKAMLKEIEEMSVDEINALSPEEIVMHLQRAEVREKAMNLAKLARDLKAHRAKDDDLKRIQEDRIIVEKSLVANKKRIQDNCTHMKGGMGSGSVMNGRGEDASDYSIIRHFLPSGTLMILCLRCGEEAYGPNPLTGQPHTDNFAEFSKFPTKNQTSFSCRFVPVLIHPQMQVK